MQENRYNYCIDRAIDTFEGPIKQQKQMNVTIKLDIKLIELSWYSQHKNKRTR